MSILGPGRLLVVNFIFLICAMADVSPGRHCEEAGLLE